MYNHILYFYYWLANALVLLIFKLVFTGMVVLGNWRFSSIEAAFYSGFWITFTVWCFWDWALAKKIPLNQPVLAFIYFFPVNSLAVWLVSRWANYTGMGIAGFGWAFVIGFTGHWLQRWVRGRVIAGSSH